MNANKVLLIALAAFYAVMWLGGIGHYALYGGPPQNAPWAAPLFLLLAGLIVLMTSIRKQWQPLCVAALLGFLSEVIGVRYDFIYSAYQYTDALAPSLLGVPLVMLSAWMTLVAYVRQMLLDLRLPRWAEILCAALWMTVIDLVIDPLAANQLGYWRWAETGWYYGVPCHNFAGWFVVSALIFLFIRRTETVNIWACYVGLTIVAFFTAIALAYRILPVAVIGLFLCLIHFAILQTSHRIARKRAIIG
jgi:uncharacterized membrane protein